MRILWALALGFGLNACLREKQTVPPPQASLQPRSLAEPSTNPVPENGPLTTRSSTKTAQFAAQTGFQQIFADVAEKAIPAVVSVHSEKQSPQDPGVDGNSDNTPFHWFFGPQGPGSSRKETGLGSGVIISEDGYVLTNNHVIEDADVIYVTLSDDREMPAKVVGADKPSDVAVIKITAKGPFTTLPFGDSDKLRIGEWVLAVGNPYGLSQTVTAGIISAKGRNNTGINSYENFLQTDAAINPGNSGGALMNLEGELIGINTAIFSRSGGYQGIGFAIPINMAKHIMEDLIRDGEVTRGWLGVSIQPLDPELAEAMGLKDRRGALVGGVIGGSPADKAGIKRGDVILSIDGITLHDHTDLLNRVALLRPGTWVNLLIHRDGKELIYKACITRRDEKRLSRLGEITPNEGEAAQSLGLSVLPLTSLTRDQFSLGPLVKHGVVVAEVSEGSRAATGRIHVGDVVEEINRNAVEDPLQFEGLVRKAMRGNRILLLIRRKGETFYTTL